MFHSTGFLSQMGLWWQHVEDEGRRLRLDQGISNIYVYGQQSTKIKETCNVSIQY